MKNLLRLQIIKTWCKILTKHCVTFSPGGPTGPSTPGSPGRPCREVKVLMAQGSELLLRSRNCHKFKVWGREVVNCCKFNFYLQTSSSSRTLLSSQSWNTLCWERWQHLLEELWRVGLMWFMRQLNGLVYPWTHWSGRSLVSCQSRLTLSEDRTLTRQITYLFTQCTITILFI